jgi:voltage-gated potassium channel Kch
LSVLILGCVGFKAAYPHDRFLDTVYRSIGLFGVGGGIPEGHRPETALEIARFLGPLVVGFAAFAAIVALYREQLHRGRLRLLRDHVVIAGAGAAGFRMATAFDKGGWRVVVVDRDALAPALAGCRERGIPVVVADASDPEILERVGVDRATLIVATCGDDGINLDVAQAARVVVRRKERERGVLTALVELDDADLLRTMRAQALVDRDPSCVFRVELFNAYVLAAEMLLNEHPPSGSHVLVVGTVGVGESLIAQMAHRRLQTDPDGRAPLRITIAGPDASIECARLLRQLREVEESSAIELGAWDFDLTPERFSELPPDVSMVYLAPRYEPEALTAALAIRERAGRWQLPIVMAVLDEGAGVASTLTHERRGGPNRYSVSTFGVLRRTMTPDALQHTTTERLARLLHEKHLERFREAQPQEGRDRSERRDPGLLPWAQLPDTVRESNRLSADGIAENLGRLRCVIVSATNRHGHPFEFADLEIEELAPLEHRRWERAMIQLGYKPGKVKDHKRRRHPTIGVEWEDLAESYKARDREHVRWLPDILAKAGFELRRRGELTAEDDKMAAPTRCDPPDGGQLIARAES